MKHNQQYVHGSNAEKLVNQGDFSDFEYQKEDSKVSSKTKPTKKQQAKKENKSTYRPKLMHNILLMLIIVITLGTLAVLIKVQFAVNDQADYNIQLQKELIALKNENLKLESEISKSMDINEIYRIASEELGMIQPTQENIRYITTDNNAYTVQYTTVLTNESDEGINLGDFLGFISEGW